MEAKAPGKRTELIGRARQIVVKVGSAVLTEDGILHRPTIFRLAGEIAALRKKACRVTLVSSGAIATGLGKLGLKKKPASIPEKQAVAAVGQGTLIQLYEEAFEQYGLRVAQVLLTRDDLTHRGRYLNARNTLTTLLSWGIIPIINENDTVAVDEIKFGDNDNLSALIAHLIEADLLVILTDLDGLYNQDPRENPQAQLIPLVEKIDAQIIRYTSQSSGTLGVGGMRSKLKAARKATLQGTPVVIANGRREGVLKDLSKGRLLGTLFLPQKRPLSRRKHWIAYTLKPRGEVVLDPGACQALLEKGKSLLPAGILAVRGRFGVGACVSCLTLEGKRIAKGLVNYSSTDLQKIKGLRTSEIEKRLEFKHSDEAIHRDNLVLTPEEL
ncbi:MAG: glutamate 5-kinase [Deltaproteobacteria bacterium]|nr:glutamate 5-kinase [Deltaproteobacteria bacterium]